MNDLFATDAAQQAQPLAARLRPTSLDEYVGQQHLVGDGKPFRQALERGQLHSMILWGPPGTGKTTLALILAQAVDAAFITLSAVLSGVKDIRAAVEQAQVRLGQGRRTVLFVDEVHRFNKAQQDAFLPHVEEGTITFIGATTENPSFELNYADGDARRLLNMFEVAADLADGETPVIDAELMREVLRDAVRRFDKGGDLFYDQISALHKSVRGSDPLYIARRVVRMASEEVANADPRALTLCLQAWDVQERLGSPEGELAIAQAIAYLAVAPKSNAVYKAYNQARALVRDHPTDEVPLHLRNAPTQLMKDEGFGAEYHYAHDFPDAFVAGENYFPASLSGTRLYEPVNRGLEIKVSEKLARLRGLNAESDWQRYGEEP